MIGVGIGVYVRLYVCIYIYVCDPPKSLNGTLAVDSPFQTIRALLSPFEEQTTSGIVADWGRM